MQEKILDKHETGNRSHFSKDIKKDKQGSGITGPTSLTSTFIGGPVVTVPCAEGSASSFDTGRKCSLLEGRCAALPGTERNLPEWKEKDFLL